MAKAKAKATATQLVFGFTDIAEMLVKRENIHEGYWGIFVRFGLGAANTPGPKGGLVPTAVVPIIELGIQRFIEPNDLTVDAAEVNPREPTKSTKRPSKGAK